MLSISSDFFTFQLTPLNKLQAWRGTRWYWMDGSVVVMYGLSSTTCTLICGGFVVQLSAHHVCNKSTKRSKKQIEFGYQWPLLYRSVIDLSVQYTHVVDISLIGHVTAAGWQSSPSWSTVGQVWTCWGWSGGCLSAGWQEAGVLG